MTAAVLAGLLAGYGIAMPVGAIGVLIMSLAARAGWRIGAAAGLGTATADAVYATVAVLGGAVVAGFLAPAATPLRAVAAAVLLVLAGRTAIGALRQHRRPDPAAPPAALGTPVRAYATVLGLTLLNPATIVYFAALVLGRQAGTAGSAGAVASVAFVAAAFAASASWQLLLAGGGSLVGRVLTGARGALVTALASSAVIAILAVVLILPS